jgi:hypothetical protein
VRFIAQAGGSAKRTTRAINRTMSTTLAGATTVSNGIRALQPLGIIPQRLPVMSEPKLIHRLLNFTLEPQKRCRVEI